MKSRLPRFILALVVLVAVALIAKQYIGPKNGNAQNADATAKTASADNTKVQTLSEIIEENKVYASVNGTNITGKDVQEFASNLPPQLQQAPGKNLLTLIVNQLVNDKLITDNAFASGLENNTAVQEQLAELKTQLVRDTYLQQNVNDTITDAQLKAKYDEMLANTPEIPEVKARHILVETEDEAKAIITELDNGADFATLAQEKSTGPSATNGGDLGYFNQSSMVKEFADAAFAMEKDTYSQTPVKTQFGYHVIKVEDKRMQPKPEFAAVEQRVRAQLVDDKVRQLIDNLRSQADLTLDLPNIEPAAGQ